MYCIRKQFRFEMAHQLYKAYSKCCSDTIHGHSYVLELFLSSNELDKTDMVIDFGEAKEKLKEYIDSWDHSLVLPLLFDKEYLKMLKKRNKKCQLVPWNPTAERMAQEMYIYIRKVFPQLTKVRLHETENGFAEYYEET